MTPTYKRSDDHSAKNRALMEQTQRVGAPYFQKFLEAKAKRMEENKTEVSNAAKSFFVLALLICAGLVGALINDTFFKEVEYVTQDHDIYRDINLLETKKDCEGRGGSFSAGSPWRFVTTKDSVLTYGRVRCVKPEETIFEFELLAE